MCEKMKKAESESSLPFDLQTSKPLRLLNFSPFLLSNPRCVGQYAKGGTVHHDFCAGAGRGGVILKEV